MEHLGFLKNIAFAGGDWVIYILFFFSVLAVSVIIERIIIVNRTSNYQEKILPELTKKLEEGPEEALKALKRDSLLYRVARELADCAADGAGPQAMERHLDTRLAVERRNLEKRTLILGTLGNNAPFVGLLGTVLGVIRAFHDLGATAGQGPEVVMEGISQALIATAVGIFVALPCVASFNFLKKRIKDIIIDADRFGHQFISVLDAENKKAGAPR
jgi:biopolymer transport protein ExbB/TolQ